MDTINSSLDRTVEVGVFSTVELAATAVEKLLGSGFSKKQITVICSDRDKERYFCEFEHQDPAGTFTSRAAATGGSIGAILGGLPAVTLAIATGSAVVLIVGAATAWAMGVAGGLVGAMMTRGVEKSAANYYQQAVLNGKLLVAVETDDQDPASDLAAAAAIFTACGAKPLSLPED